MLCTHLHILILTTAPWDGVFTERKLRIKMDRLSHFPRVTPLASVEARNPSQHFWLWLPGLFPAAGFCTWQEVNINRVHLWKTMHFLRKIDAKSLETDVANGLFQSQPCKISSSTHRSSESQSAVLSTYPVLSPVIWAGSPSSGRPGVVYPWIFWRLRCQLLPLDQMPHICPALGSAPD